MPKKLSEQLRDLRKRLRYTQAEMAEKVGASRTQYANWEYGISNMPPDAVERLAELGLNAPDPIDEGMTIHATKTHLRLLIGILYDGTIADGLRKDAKEELERVLNLS